MDYREVVRRRRMVRAFDSRPISSEVVARLLAYAQRGPSSGFTQGFEFLVFDGPEQTAEFWNYQPPSMREYLAPSLPAALIIVPFAHEAAYVERYRQPDKKATARESGDDFPAPYWYIDAAFAAMLVLLGAVDEGLGAFYFSVAPNRPGVESFLEHFGIPAGFWPIGAIAVGHPRDEERQGPGAIKPDRRPEEQMLHFGRWQSE
jgi:nitroreductase